MEFDTCVEIYDPCEDGPCHNEGMCISASGAFTCYCVSGWTGEICEECIESSITVVLPANPFAYLTIEVEDFAPGAVVLTLSNFIGDAATSVNWGGFDYTIDDTETPNTIQLIPEFVAKVGQHGVVVSSQCANLTFIMTYITRPCSLLPCPACTRPLVFGNWKTPSP